MARGSQGLVVSGYWSVVNLSLYFIAGANIDELPVFRFKLFAVAIALDNESPLPRKLHGGELNHPIA